MTLERKYAHPVAWWLATALTILQAVSVLVLNGVGGVPYLIGFGVGLLLLWFVLYYAFVIIGRGYRGVRTRLGESEPGGETA